MRSIKMSALSLLMLLAACTEAPEEEGISCTTDARTSVRVTVLDVDGMQTNEATVTYTKDGMSQACEVGGDSIYNCGFEVAGELTIEAVGLDASATETVTVTEDECHVETQEITMQLQGNV